MYVFWGMALGFTAFVASPEPDPITAILSRDWAAVGGWSLFIGLCMLIVLGAFREIWVPGARLRRVEKLLEDANELVKQLTTQNAKLIEANELTQYVISQVAPIPKPRRRSTVAASDEGET
jgi:hypothetical protein